MFKDHYFPKSIIIQAVYFKFRFGLSYREIGKLMAIRGVKVDHATIQRWVFKFTPLLEKEFKKLKKAVGRRWRIDETYIKVKGKWYYLYRAVDKQEHTIDFLLTKRTLSGIEMAQMIRKDQLITNKTSMFKSFYALAS